MKKYRTHDIENQITPLFEDIKLDSLADSDIAALKAAISKNKNLYQHSLNKHMLLLDKSFLIIQILTVHSIRITKRVQTLPN